MFGEPAPTPYDLHFSLFGFPVRVHPYFWLFTALMSGAKTLQNLLIWLAAVFVAILFHELGHAVALRAFGSQPWIVLYGFGGVTLNQPGRGEFRRKESPWSQILISAAGPLAGFLLAAWIVLLAYALRIPLDRESWFGIPFYLPEFASPYLTEFVGSLIFVCIVWGVFNLLPIYPLDGGQIVRQLLGMANARQGVRWSALSSAVVAGLIAAYFAWQMLQFARFQMQFVGHVDLGSLFRSGGLFNLLLFGALAWLNYQQWQRQSSGPF